MKRNSTIKWIMSAALCLALVFALLPAAAMAEETEVECSHTSTTYTNGFRDCCGE